MITVLATIELAAGRRDDFLAVFEQVVPLVRAEEGCLEYGPTVDADSGIEKQRSRRENVVVVVEKWESLDALKAHLVAPHMGEYREQVQDLVTGMDLQVLEPAWADA